MTADDARKLSLCAYPTAEILSEIFKKIQGQAKNGHLNATYRTSKLSDITFACIVSELKRLGYCISVKQHSGIDGDIFNYLYINWSNE